MPPQTNATPQYQPRDAIPETTGTAFGQAFTSLVTQRYNRIWADIEERTTRDYEDADLAYRTKQKILLEQKADLEKRIREVEDSLFEAFDGGGTGGRGRGGGRSSSATSDLFGDLVDLNSQIVDSANQNADRRLESDDRVRKGYMLAPETQELGASIRGQFQSDLNAGLNPNDAALALVTNTAARSQWTRLLDESFDEKQATVLGTSTYEDLIRSGVSDPVARRVVNELMGVPALSRGELNAKIGNEQDMAARRVSAGSGQAGMLMDVGLGRLGDVADKEAAAKEAEAKKVEDIDSYFASRLGRHMAEAMADGMLSGSEYEVGIREGLWPEGADAKDLIDTYRVNQEAAFLHRDEVSPVILRQIDPRLVESRTALAEIDRSLSGLEAPVAPTMADKRQMVARELAGRKQGQVIKDALTPMGSRQRKVEEASSQIQALLGDGAKLRFAQAISPALAADFDPSKLSETARKFGQEIAQMQANGTAVSIDDLVEQATRAAEDDREMADQILAAYAWHRQQGKNARAPAKPGERPPVPFPDLNDLPE